MASRGRPIKSAIRQNIVEILYFMSRGYGYDIYKVYRNLFPGITMRSVYYNLRKGVATGEFKINKVSTEKGEYSWGGEVEKIYYELGPKSKPTMSKKVKEYFENNQKESKK